MDIYEIRQTLNSGQSIYTIPLRVTYYARVSTDKDEQLHSLSAQVAYYSEFIQKNPNWTYVEGYVDEGLSGTSVKKRENFLRMIEDARTKKFDFIVTKEISRFSRNTLDSIQYTQELLRCGVGVLFQSDNINTLMPDAELRLTIMSSIAQDEVRKTSERVKFGFRRAIENGVVLGSNRIWGYEKDQGKLIIKEDEAEIVRLIFDLYANQQMGIRSVANYLTKHGYRNTNDKPFSFSTIRGIICNPKYKGYYCGRKTSKVDFKLGTVKRFSSDEWVMYHSEDTVPPIVSEGLWEKANSILAERSENQSSKEKAGYKNKYAYSGKIFCGVHKKTYYRSLYRNKTGNREVWQCQEYLKTGSDGCKTSALYTDEADTIVRYLLESCPLVKAEVIEELVHLYELIGNGGDAEEKDSRCQESLKGILRKKDKLLDLNVSGRISDDEFAVRNEQLNQEIKKLQDKLVELEKERAQNREMTEMLKGVRKAIVDELDFPAGFSGGIINLLVERIEVQETVDKSQIKVLVWSDMLLEKQVYLITRHRGKASVCSRQYI